MDPPHPSVAIVIGSGMCAHPTAQVLSEHFQRVIVVERDHPEVNNSMTALDMAAQEKETRPGVTQYKQLHAMLARGLLELDSIFQRGRYSEALAAAGGHIVNQYETYLVCHPLAGLVPWLRLGSRHNREASMSAICTRHLFETTARKLVSENPRVEFVYGTTVTGLLFESNDGDNICQGEGAAAAAAGAGRGIADKHGEAVTGVRLSDGSCLHGQLVVDCSGRGSSLPNWLAAAGYKRPRLTRAGCDTGYTNWFVKLDPQVDRTLTQNGVFVFTAIPAAPERTCTLFMRTEGEEGVWLAGVGGNEGVYPAGQEPQELLDFAEQKVWHPAAARLLAGSTQLAPAAHKHGLMSTWRHYEEIELPDGLLVLGDAICSFNPLYGQGMTVAAIEAATLRQLLSQRAAKHKRTPPHSSADSGSSADNSSSSGGGGGSSTAWLSGLNGELQKAVLPTIQLAWQMAVGGDLRYPTATCNEKVGGGPGQALLMGYFDLLFKYAATDPVVNESLLRVISMLDGPEGLMRPAVLSRVLLNKFAEFVPPGVAAAVRRAVQQYASWLGLGCSVGLVSKAGGGGGAAGFNHPEALLQLLGCRQ